MDINSMSPASGRYLNENNNEINMVDILTTALNAMDNAIDPVTGAYIAIEADHATSHLGYGYKAHIEASALASGQSLSWCFTGPETLFVHLKNISLSVLGSSGRLELLKAPEVTVNTGTSIPLVNTNDNSVFVAQSTLKAAPTYTGGTLWDKVVAYADSTNQVVGTASFQSSPYEENVTKDGNTKYILKLTNIGSDAMTLAWIKIFFYEEPSGIVGGLV